MISDGLKLNDIRNREIAIGGGFQLSARETKPFTITLDIADARFANTDNGMTLLSFSL